MHWSFMIGWIISSHMEMGSENQRKFLFFPVVGDDVTWFLNEYFRVVRTIRFHPPRYAHHFLIIPRFIGLQLPDIFQLKIQMLQKWLPQNHSQLPTQQVVHFSLWSFPFWAAWLCIVGVLFSRNKTCESITPIVSLVRFVILEVASLLFYIIFKKIRAGETEPNSPSHSRNPWTLDIVYVCVTFFFLFDFCFKAGSSCSSIYRERKHNWHQKEFRTHIYTISYYFFSSWMLHHQGVMIQVTFPFGICISKPYFFDGLHVMSANLGLLLDFWCHTVILIA